MAVSEFLEPKWRQAFKFYDVDNDGLITAKDYRKLSDYVSQRTGVPPLKLADGERPKWFTFLQIDPSLQEIDEESWIAACTERYKDVENFKKLLAISASRYFDVLDSNGDGQISPEEHRVYYEGMGVANRDFVKTLFSQLDADNDGFIDRQELIDGFVRYFTSSHPTERGPLFFFGVPCSAKTTIE